MAEQMDANVPVEPLKQELRCSVCRDIFRNPSVLPCSHSFCQECLQGATKFSGKQCPLCRKDFREGQAIPNRDLNNVCQAYVRNPPPGIQKPEWEAGCQLHMKPLELFCQKDEQPVCVKCVPLHNTHTLLSLTEAVPICKVSMSQRKEGLLCKALYHKNNLSYTRCCTAATVSLLQMSQ